MHKVCTRWKQQYKGKHQKEAECHESTNSVTVTAVVKPHILDQSNKEVTKVPRSWSGELDKSSKVLKFLSRHTVHMRHNGIKFQMWEWCLPNQLCHPNSKSAKPLTCNQMKNKKWSWKKAYHTIRTDSINHWKAMRVPTPHPPFLLSLSLSLSNR